MYDDLIYNLPARQYRKMVKVFNSLATKLIYEGLQQDIMQNDFVFIYIVNEILFLANISNVLKYWYFFGQINCLPNILLYCEFSLSIKRTPNLVRIIVSQTTSYFVSFNFLC